MEFNLKENLSNIWKERKTWRKRNICSVQKAKSPKTLLSNTHTHTYTNVDLINLILKEETDENS